MPNNADELLQSLLGDVQTTFGGSIDVSDIVSKSTTNNRVQVSPPKLFIEDAKEAKKQKRREKRDDEKHHHSTSKRRSSSKKENPSQPWLIEPMKRMPVADDLPIGADFQLFHPKIREDPSKDSKKEKKKKEKKAKKKKKKTKEDEAKETLELVPRNLSIKYLPPNEPKSKKFLEDGEICDESQNNGGWMSLSAEKVKGLENTDEILKKKLEKAQKKKKKKDKEKDKNKDKNDRKKSPERKKHKSKNDKKKAKEKAKTGDNGKEKGKNHESSKHDDSHHTRSRSGLRSTGSLSRPLSPKKDSSDKSKILPPSWSKRLNGFLKDSNKEFSSTSSVIHESSRTRDTETRASSRNRRHSLEKERPDSRHSERDREKDKYYCIPERRPRSRSKTPAIGRGRNYFRRTDAEWREHQTDRIRKRKQSPVRIYEKDYMDKHGNVDKKKLMDLATRNVTKLAMSGALPKGYELLATIKNKSIQQLVDLCQQLHNDDERARFGRPSSSESEGDDDGYDAGWGRNSGFAIREVKEPEKPKYEMIDGVPFQVKSADDRMQEDSFLRVSYPVSSGLEHRQKEVEPNEDEIAPLALSTALARIKTNIPPVFLESFETHMLPLMQPMKPLPLPPPEPTSRALLNYAAQLSSSTGQKPEVVSNMLGVTETLSRPIEISKPADTEAKIVSPVIPSKKPMVIRASFFKSGKKAAEEVLKKIGSGPEPVPAPLEALAAFNTHFTDDNVPKESPHEPLPYTLPVEAVIPIEPPKESVVPKEVTHSDALSAILDRVDQLMTQGKIKEMSTVEKKDLEILKTPEKRIENYVKVPDGGIVKKPPEPEKVETTVVKDIVGTDEKMEVTEVIELNEDEKEFKEKRKKEKKEKKNKKRKHETEKGEIREEKKKKKKRTSSSSLRVETSQNFIGPEIPGVKERPLPSAVSNDFDYRNPLPFIRALTAPQLAIEAAPTSSLRAEWNDPKNPLVASINNDDSVPLPFRIIPPTVQPLVKPEDLVFKTPRCITHPPKMINELVSRRAKYSLILQQDPNDRYARRQIEDIDREMSAWAESKNIPGRFTGRTGARVLSVDELAPTDPRYNSWARKDLFSNAPEHESEFALKILEKMGWQKGDGLGRQLNGPREPLKLEIKADKRGLSTGNEKGSGRRETVQDINGKNPVSLVMEYTAHRRLQPPTFTCIENGPSTARRFLWKCIIDGVEYQPSMPSSNKKVGKSQVCMVVLQSLGLIPPIIPGT